MLNRRRTRNPLRGKPRARRFVDRPISYLIELVCCLAFLGFLGYKFAVFIQTSGYFNVQTVTIEGVELLDEADILALSGITNEDCIFFLDRDEISRNVLSSPFVRECRVTRTFPHRVTVAIRERVPMATLLASNRQFELDQECTVLRELTSDEPHVGPFITNGYQIEDVPIGRPLDDESRRGALAAWKAFRNTSMAQDVTVSEIAALRDSRLCMYVDELDCEIRWGRGDMDKQAWKLDLFWRTQNKRVPFKEYVDLRFGDDVVCR